MANAAKNPNRFEMIAETDIDGAVLQVSIQHHMVGPAGPGIRVNTGAVKLTIAGQLSDIDTMIEALLEARPRLVALESVRVQRLTRTAAAVRKKTRKP